MRGRLLRHLTVLIVGAGVLRVGVVPAEVCPPVSLAAVDASIEAAVGWIAGNQAPTGRFTYGYDRAGGRVNPGYNDARHGGVIMSLYQAYAEVGSPRALAAADAGVAFALDRLLATDAFVAWDPGGDVPVGPNALLLAGLAMRRAATGDPVHDDVMRGMGRFLVGQQQADGSVHASWNEASRSSVPVTAVYATGQASWALALLDRVFPDEGWGEAAVLTLDYLATVRDRVEGATLARLPDHWAAYTIADLRPDLRTELHLEYARDLAGFFGMRLRFEAQRRGTGLNLWLRWYPGPPAGVGTAFEGIGVLHTMAVGEPAMDDLRANMVERIRCTAGFMVERQIDPETAAAAPSPRLVEGAWFYRDYTQMDDQQHVLSGLLLARAVLAGEEWG